MGTEKKEEFYFSDDILRNIFDSLSAHIAIIDKAGQIIETNRAWKKFSFANGVSEETDFRQMNYFSICAAAKGKDFEDANAVVTGIKDVLAKRKTEFRHDYPCHSPMGPQWFYMRAILMESSDRQLVIISHENITDLKLAQEVLKTHQEELEDKNQSLEEANIALKVLIQQREKDKAEIEQKFLSNIKTLILPYIQKLKLGQLSKRDETLVTIMEDHLANVVSPLLHRLSNTNVLLTPQEIQVAALVKDGKTTTEIADILFVTEATINFHRKNLRNKLGIKNRKTNLRSYLMSMS